jgi:Kef-type K+ transport system membrane component KefB
MKRLFTIVGAVIAAVICAAAGAYILWQFHTTPGLVGGAALVLLGVAIALPVPLHEGAMKLKENVVLVVPVIVDALKGGSRKTDPPMDPPTDGDKK